MKIEKPENEGYAAIVTKIRNIIPLDNCDNVVGTTIFGLQAIVGKNVKVGDVGIFFPAETQLSDKFAYNNNLYRHSDKNKIQGVKGYIEDNRRVKAVKFRGHLSSCLFMPLESLSWTKVNIGDLIEGDTFDKLNDEEICQKYVVRRKTGHKGDREADKRFKRIDKQFLPEHMDTSNYFRTTESVKGNSRVVVTQKLHGTSIRIGHTFVKRKLNLLENILKVMGVQIKEVELDYVYGSRKVIKDINNPNHKHFYKLDIWSEEGSKLQGILPEGYIVYGELVGWTANNEPIQKGYTYDIEIGKCELYIYRVAAINTQGQMLDLSWGQLKEFCSNYGLNYVPEVWTGLARSLKIERYLEKSLFTAGHRTCLSLGKNKELVDEGVCIRVESLIPRILKAKSQKFLLHETKLLDEGIEDLESQES